MMKCLKITLPNKCVVAVLNAYYKFYVGLAVSNCLSVLLNGTTIYLALIPEYFFRLLKIYRWMWVIYLPSKHACHELSHTSTHTIHLFIHY